MSSDNPSNNPLAFDSKIELVITSRERDIGGFFVRRILPYATHRMVGPFIFFDHMGPADFKPGEGMDVRPHPHINLATVTYLFEGKITHRDSLGSRQDIEPGDVNWMTAGKGIVHSERTPEAHRLTGSRMHGIQLWVALPSEFEETAPSFYHHSKAVLPEFKVNDAEIKLLLGKAFNYASPVKVFSDLFYMEVKLKKGGRLNFPAHQGLEAAAYLVSGKAKIEDQEIEQCSMAVGRNGSGFNIDATEDSLLMILGGTPVGDRHIYWNFVSSSKDRIEEAKQEWQPGPKLSSARFHPIPDDDQEFIPLPKESPKIAKGTIM